MDLTSLSLFYEIIVVKVLSNSFRQQTDDKEIQIMAVKKTELYSSLWASCDALRGGIDASQYKDYWIDTKIRYGQITGYVKTA